MSGKESAWIKPDKVQNAFAWRSPRLAAGQSDESSRFHNSAEAQTKSHQSPPVGKADTVERAEIGIRQKGVVDSDLGQFESGAKGESGRVVFAAAGLVVLARSWNSQPAKQSGYWDESPTQWNHRCHCRSDRPPSSATVSGNSVVRCETPARTIIGSGSLCSGDKPES